jgi:hypothetical protein
MQKGGAAAQVSEDEQWFFNRLIFIGWEENIIQPEKKPVNEHTEGPDNAEERKEDNAFSGEAGSGVFGVEEGAVEGTKEKGKVIFHVRVCILAMFACSEKARLGFFDYSISKYVFWINREPPSASAARHKAISLPKIRNC